MPKEIIYQGKRYQEKRKNFLINKPLQLRFMAYVTGTIVFISTISLASIYIGIWSSILEAFSDPNFRNDLAMAARMSQYEDTRFMVKADPLSSLSFFKQAEKLSFRQREIFKQILDDTNRKLISKLLFVYILIAWGSIYLSHKIAGPLYRFHATLQEMQKGNFTIRCHLRKHDEAQTVGEDFNRTLVYLDVHTSRLKNILRENADKPDRLIPQLKEELSKIKTSVDNR